MHVGKEPEKRPVAKHVTAVMGTEGAKPALHDGVTVRPARTVMQPALPPTMAGQAQKTGTVVVLVVLVVRTVGALVDRVVTGLTVLRVVLELAALAQSTRACGD